MVTAHRLIYKPNILANSIEGSHVAEGMSKHYMNHLFKVSSLTKCKQ